MREGDGVRVSGGPVVDRLAKQGDPERFTFSKPRIDGYDYSFSGLKTSFLYFLRDELKEDPDFIEKNKEDLCASLQKTIIDILMDKLYRAAEDLGINEVAVAGGVSANSGLRKAFEEYSREYGGRFIFPGSRTLPIMRPRSRYYKYLDGSLAAGCGAYANIYLIKN